MSALAMQSFGFDGTEVRALWLEDAPWFVAQDVCACLEIANYRNVTASLDDDEKGVHTMDTLGGAQQVTIISESGVFALVFKSRKPAAAQFRKWVTGEVLPTLRRTGKYLLEPSNDEGEDFDEDFATPDAVERLKTKMAVMRETRMVFGPKTARAMWARLGLPEVRTQLPVATCYTPDALDPGVAEWIAARTELLPGARTESMALFDDYCAWCEEHSQPKLALRTFGEMLTCFGLRPKKSGRIYRLGIRLKH